jgi:hypothetical protein
VQPGRIQPVSDRPEEDATKVGKKGVAEDHVEEEDDGDEEPFYVQLVRKIPMCGEGLADKINPEA